MANNRMYLVNRFTDQTIMIAKYFPSEGWFVKNVDTVNELLKNGNDRSLFGDNWELKYESVQIVDRKEFNAFKAGFEQGSSSLGEDSGLEDEKALLKLYIKYKEI